MTTTADKIRALMINKDRPELGGEWNLALEAAAALVEAEPPQAVTGRWETTSEHIARDMAEGRFPEVSDRKWLTPPPVDASPAPDPVSKERLEDDVSHSDDVAVNKFARAMKAKLAQARTKGRGGWDDPSQCSELYLAKLLVGHLGKGNPGTFEDVANFAMMLHQRGANPCVLKQAISVLPAPDPVSPTPTLDAMAMQRAWYTAGIRAAALRYRAGSGPDSWDYFALAEAAILDLLTFERVDPPLPSPAAALAEAMRLPEIKAQMGGYPPAPDGCTVSPPSYSRHPYAVQHVWGSGWHLIRHHNVAGVSSTVQKFGDDLTAALAAMKGASHE